MSLWGGGIDVAYWGDPIEGPKGALDWQSSDNNETCDKYLPNEWGLLTRSALRILGTNKPRILEVKPKLLTPDCGEYMMSASGLYERKPPMMTLTLNLNGVSTFGGHFTAPTWLSQQYSAMLTAQIYGYFGFTSTPKGPKPDEIDTTRTEPFVGWKTLKVKVTKKGKLRLVGNGNTKYGIDAHAKCNRGVAHAVPDWECSCGFYALSERPTHAELGWFMAQVELFGTVIEGEHGWRASRQRVLSMEVFRECQAENGNCGDPASGFQVTRGGKVWPVCARHAPLGFATLADLTAQLGTEVRWVGETQSPGQDVAA